VAPKSPQDIQRRERKRKKKRGLAFPWLGRSGSPTIPTGIDWSTPLSALRSGWTILAYAPQGTLLRFAIGAALGVHGIMLGASILSSDGEKWNGEEATFTSRGSARNAAGAAVAGRGRSPMASLITGYKNLFGEGPLPAGNEVGGPEAEDGDGAAPDSAWEDPVTGGAGDGESEDGEAAGDAAKEAMGQLASAKGIGTLSTNIGGAAGTSAGFSGAPLRGPGGSTGSSARSKNSIRSDKGRSAKTPAGRRGALKQLGFANTQSLRGRGAKSGEAGYEAASTAFEGQTSPGSAGTPIGGSGAGLGGTDTKMTPSNPAGSPVNTSGSENTTCPAGYYPFEGECSYIGGRNQTPWQGMLENANVLLIAAAIMIFAGLMLLWKAPPGPWQIFGGVLVGLGIGLVVTAFAIGNQIEDKYGQGRQRDVVYDEGGRAIRGDGRLSTDPRHIPELENRGGPNGKFGFQRNPPPR